MRLEKRSIFSSINKTNDFYYYFIFHYYFESWIKFADSDHDSTNSNALPISTQTGKLYLLLRNSIELD